MGPCVNGKALGNGGGGGDDNGPEGGGGGGGSSPDPFGPPKGPDPIGQPELPSYPGNGGGGGPSKPTPPKDDPTSPDNPNRNLPDFTEPQPYIPTVDPLPDKLLCPICHKAPCICEKEVDCEELAPEAGDNSVKMTSLYNQAAALPTFSEFLKVTEGSSIEYGTTGYTDGQGNFHLLSPYTDNEPHYVNPRRKSDAKNITMFHNHPSGNACSVGDVIALIDLNDMMDSFISIYTTVQGKTYVIYIYDREMMDSFTGSSNYGSMEGQYSNAFTRLRNAGYDTPTSHLYAIAFMLQELNTGIAILSKSDGENIFHQHRTIGSNPDECGLPTIMEILKCL